MERQRPRREVLGVDVVAVLRRLLLIVVVLGLPALADAQGTVSQIGAISSTGTMQSGATATGNGTAMSVDGYAVLVVTVNCSACSGGTTVNFEVSDGTNFAARDAILVGTSTVSTSTTTSGLTIWSMPVAGFKSARARISGYSAGTVTVTGTAVPVAGPQTVVTVLPGNTANTTPWLFIGNKSAGASAGSFNFGVMPVIATASHPSWSEGLQYHISTNLYGAARILFTKPSDGTDATLSTDATDGAAASTTGPQVKGKDASGNTVSFILDACEANVQTSTPISITTATTTRIVAPTSAKKTYICGLFLAAAATDNIAIVEGTGGTCGSSTAGVIGGSTAANGVNLAATSHFELQAGKVAHAVTAGTNVDLCLITSAATPLAGVIKWVQQ